MKKKEIQSLSWRFRPGLRSIDKDKCRLLAQELKLPYEIAAILFQRDFMSREKAALFLYPQLKKLPSPYMMKDMEKAVLLVEDALKKKQPVTIYGDYDVDGMSATALLVEFLNFLGLNVSFYLPDRLSDGYGIHSKVIAELAKSSQEPGLLITVDCGITAVEEVEFAKEKGFKVLIADHHEPQDSVPNADAVLNPKQIDCKFPFKDLAGVGVAFFLLMGIRRRFINVDIWTKISAPNLKKYLDLVALGTVADVMPLTELNRILVKAGIEVLSEKTRPGIRALCEHAKIESKKFTAEDISYKLSPRLNAAGRIGNPELAVNLLLSCDMQIASNYARQLENLNSKRKELELLALENAKNQCIDQIKKGRKILFVYGQFHAGIIGILASRLVDQFRCPTIVFTDNRESESEQLLGSGRSVDGINLFKVLAHCAALLIRYGGHDMAIGVTLEKDKFEEVTEAIHEAILFKDIQRKNGKIIDVDYMLTGNETFTDCFIKSLQYLEPFGEKNPEPVFILKNVRLINLVVIKNHLKFTLMHNGVYINGIAFGMGHLIDIAHQPVILAFKLRYSYYRGEKNMEIQASLIEPAS